MSAKYFLKVGNSQVILAKSNSAKRRLWKTSDFKVSDLQKALSKDASLCVVSVVPKIDRLIEKNLSATFLNKRDFSIRPAYTKGIGCDRLLNMESAASIYKTSSFVVIDFGTAITVDFVDKAKKHLGGWICAGPSLWASSLQVGTAKLPFILPRSKGYSMSRQSFALGESTRDCIQLGYQQLSEALIDRAQLVGRERLGKNVKIILTGGWSNFFSSSQSRPSIKFEPELWLKGMESLANGKTGLRRSRPQSKKGSQSRK